MKTPATWQTLLLGGALILLTVSLAPAAEPTGSVTFIAGGTSVDGDNELYREHHWRRDGFSAGIEEMHLQLEALTIDGHGIFDDHNYELDLGYDFTETRFLRVGIANLRKNYDDTGGYLPNGSSFSLNRDLQLDDGSYYLEVGQSGPDLPELILGYEYHYKDGTKSTLEYGRVGDGVYPATKFIDEGLHVLRLDAKHEINGFVLRDHARYEDYDLETSRVDRVPAAVGGTTYDEGHVVNEDADYRVFSNAISVEKWITDNGFLGFGYLYQEMSGNNDFAMDQFPGRRFWEDGGLPVADSSLNRDKFYQSQVIEVDKDVHLFNLSGLFNPVESVTMVADFAAEYARSDADARVLLIEGTSVGGGFYDIDTETVASESAVDQNRFEEGLELRYTGFSAAQLYAEGRFVQDQYDHYEYEFDTGSGSQLMLRQSDVDVRDNRYRVGIATSLIPGFLSNAYYQRRTIFRDYDHDVDEEAAGDAGEGYSGHLLAHDTRTDELTLRLSCSPRSWLRTAFQYQLVSTEATNFTRPIPDANPADNKPGGEADVMDYRSDVYTIKLDLVPNDRLYCTTTVSYADVRTEIPVLDVPNRIDDYYGDYVTVMSSARYALSDLTAATIGCSWTYADNQQTNTTGQPQSADYDWLTIRAGVNHRLSDTVSIRVEYSYTDYEDANFNTAADYTAHSIFCSLTKEFK